MYIVAVLSKLIIFDDVTEGIYSIYNRFVKPFCSLTAVRQFLLISNLSMWLLRFFSFSLASWSSWMLSSSPSSGPSSGNSRVFPRPSGMSTCFVAFEFRRVVVVTGLPLKETRVSFGLACRKAVRLKPLVVLNLGVIRGVARGGAKWPTTKDYG